MAMEAPGRAGFRTPCSDRAYCEQRTVELDLSQTHGGPRVRGFE